MQELRHPKPFCQGLSELQPTSKKTPATGHKIQTGGGDGLQYAVQVNGRPDTKQMRPQRTRHPRSSHIHHSGWKQGNSQPQPNINITAWGLLMTMPIPGSNSS